MSEGRVTLELDKYECGVIFHSLKDKRNQMLKEERPTDAVDDVLLKVMEKMKGPRRNPRRGHRRHEER